MILTRTEINKLIREKKLLFSPQLDRYQSQPHAVDLRLGATFYVSRPWEITQRGREILTVSPFSSEKNYEIIEIKPGQFFELSPGESIIASSLEKITLHSPNIMGVLYPRSSVNRRGLSVDMTGIIDANYSGHLMVPLLNKTSSQIIRIYPGERFCQIIFHTLSRPLSAAEAQRHGVKNAKYHLSKTHKLEKKSDDASEIEFIKKGNLSGLKAQKKLFN